MMIAFLTLAAMTAAQPGASDAPKMIRIDVRTADLDLTSRHGRREVDRRVRRAAAKICGSDDGGQRDVMGCIDDIIDRTRPRVAEAIATARTNDGQVARDATAVRRLADPRAVFIAAP